ncbi:hypothetical protein RKD37_002671 [Streptomyces ambofaciens]
MTGTALQTEWCLEARRPPRGVVWDSSTASEVFAVLKARIRRRRSDQRARADVGQPASRKVLPLAFDAGPL